MIAFLSNFSLQRGQVSFDFAQSLMHPRQNSCFFLQFSKRFPLGHGMIAKPALLPTASWQITQLLPPAWSTCGSGATPFSAAESRLLLHTAVSLVWLVWLHATGPLSVPCLLGEPASLSESRSCLVLALFPGRRMMGDSSSCQDAGEANPWRGHTKHNAGSALHGFSRARWESVPHLHLAVVWRTTLPQRPVLVVR